MTEITEYNINIVKRTKEILNDYYPVFEENDREATFLMNCLLGLIISITEIEKGERKLLRGSIDDEFIKNIPEKIGFLISRNLSENLANLDLIEINVHVGHKNDLIGKDKLWFISKIRNSIAHQNIFAINKNGKWDGVKLWNLNNSQKDFEIVFSLEELKIFAIDLAKKFLEIRNID
jgi:hypothetical protein